MRRRPQQREVAEGRRERPKRRLQCLPSPKQAKEQVLYSCIFIICGLLSERFVLGRRGRPKKEEKAKESSAEEEDEEEDDADEDGDD